MTANPKPSIKPLSLRAAAIAGAALAIAGLGLTWAAGPAAAVEAREEIPVRGVVRAQRQATLSTGVKAVVSAVRFREGERFAKGDVLIEFDCRLLAARLDAARAIRKEKAVALKGARYLQGMKAGSAQDTQVAQAQVEQADAEVAALQVELDGCRIVAPFDGAVGETMVRENELPAEGAPLMSIVDPGSAEIELIVASNWIGRMAPGREFEFLVDETGQAYRAVIRRTAPAVDPVSQTVKVYGQFIAEAVAVLPGMSGDARFDGDWALR